MLSFYKYKNDFRQSQQELELVVKSLKSKGRQEKMEGSKKEKQEIKTFPVPVSLREIKENITLNTNSLSEISKEDIINQAVKFHSQGNILEAAKYYQYCLNQSFNDHRLFSNYGALLKDLGKLKDAEIYQRKAIELNPDFAQAHSNLAIILKDLGKLKDAELSTRKAIELKPELAEAHSNLGNILVDRGKLKEAEVSLCKAVEIEPENKTIKNNLIQLLAIYQPKKIDSNKLYVINEQFTKINLSYPENMIITDKEAIQIYNDGLKIYRKYNLNLGTELSQVYKANEINLNCKRHKLIFKEHKVIPEFCFGCYKVQVEVESIVELIKLFLIFNKLKLRNNNTRKSMIELRPKILGFYKGLIYCLNLNEALEISKKLNIQIQNNIRCNLISKVKRGCSEYPLEFPQYKEINTSGEQLMNYNENWRRIEKKIDTGTKEWGKSSKSIEGYNLNNFLIMRNWIAYAQKIGDQSVNKITNEQIKGPKNFKYLNRDFHCKQAKNKTI